MKKSKTQPISKKRQDELGWVTVEELFDSIRQLAKTLKTNPKSRELVETSRRAFENWHSHAS